MLSHLGLDCVEVLFVDEAWIVGCLRQLSKVCAFAEPLRDLVVGLSF
jgi:hypothetical protein